jgi:hypothetical protein
MLTQYSMQLNSLGRYIIMTRIVKVYEGEENGEKEEQDNQIK